jgi:HSP20 family protein
MSLPTRVQRSLVDFPFEAFNQDFGPALNRFFNRQGEVLAPYAVDVREDPDHIYVEAELPGYKKEEIDITLENGTLTLSAERKSEQRKDGNGGANGGGEWLLNERRYSRFLRSFTLPPTVDAASVDAKLADGVLKVTLNKRAETKPRKITVA